MKTRPWWFYNQSAVIPYRLMDGRLELLLITSRKRGRWIVPKGVIDPGKTAEEAAANEAYEEAGVRGQIVTGLIGEYSYEKWGGTCKVQVFLLEVEVVLDAWPEQDARRREWMSAEKAAESVQEEALRRIILSIPVSLNKS
jgi:8-oxo-dGTP pyrophosphatase MutT (NUDIX family)